MKQGNHRSRKALKRDKRRLVKWPPPMRQMATAGIFGLSPVKHAAGAIDGINVKGPGDVGLIASTLALVKRAMRRGVK